MKTKGFKTRFLIVTGLCVSIIASSSIVFAGERERSHREVVVVGHDRYHYREGRFYRPGWFGFEFAIGSAPIGAVIRILPFGYRTIVIRGAPYYYYDDVYYRPCPSGYVVVPAPIVTTTPQAVSSQTITINVPNSNGSYTPVTLVRRDNGYVGPQGEYYPDNPTVEQLKALYGK